MEYQAFDQDELVAVWNFWDLAGGMYGEAFLLTDTLFYHPVQVVAKIVNPFSTFWRFNQEELSSDVTVSHQEQTVKILGIPRIVSPGCGIYNLSVELKSAIA